jgi:hypothetical protein
VVDLTPQDDIRRKDMRVRVDDAARHENLF